MTSSTASRRGLTIANMPSLVLFVLSWMLTPSSVMLIELCGSPLICELRTSPPCGVWTPGRNWMKLSVLRLVSGSVVIAFVFSVVETAAVCVWTISERALDDDALLEAADLELRSNRRGAAGRHDDAL